MPHKNATKHQSTWVRKNRTVYNEYMNEYVKKYQKQKRMYESEAKRFRNIILI
jgi:hypothetical protein